MYIYIYYSIYIYIYYNIYIIIYIYTYIYIYQALIFVKSPQCNCAKYTCPWGHPYIPAVDSFHFSEDECGLLDGGGGSNQGYSSLNTFFFRFI